VLRFAALFRSAHETVKLSEKAQDDAEKAASSASATIVNVTGSDFGGSSLSQISSPAEPPPIASAEIDEEAVWDELCALDAEQLTAVLEDASAVLFSDGTLHEWLNWRREYHGSENNWVPDGTPGGTDCDQWRRFNPKPPTINPQPSTLNPKPQTLHLKP
jgi:hypothetical protein